MRIDTFCPNQLHFSAAVVSAHNLVLCNLYGQRRRNAFHYPFIGLGYKCVCRFKLQEQHAPYNRSISGSVLGQVNFVAVIRRFCGKTDRLKFFAAACLLPIWGLLVAVDLTIITQ